MPSSLKISGRRFVELLILAVMGWYLLLVTLHYFNQRPLWNDEVCVYNSLRAYTPAQIFARPLVDGQQFPKLHLYAIQLFSAPHQFSLLSLRLFSFLAMLGAFFIWMRLGVREMPGADQRLAWALCWAGSIPLIYYGAELKPYSFDVCAAALFLWFVSRQAEIKQKRPSLYVFLLGALPWLGAGSYMAFLMFIFPFYNICRLGGARWGRDLAIYTVSCLVVVCLVYWFDVRVSNAGDLQDYWKGYFISYDSIPQFFGSTFEGVNNLICRWFAEQPKWIRMAARFFVAFGLWEMVAGFKSQLARDAFMFRSVRSVALIVFLELYALGLLHKYAFSVPRTSLFFAPMILFLAVCGFQRLGNAGVLLRIAFIAYLAVVSVGIAGVIVQGDMGAQAVLFR